MVEKPKKQNARSREADSLRLAGDCARIADDKKAREILILDLRNLTYITDYFVIVSAGNPRQLGAISTAIEQEMRQRSIRAIGVQGDDASGWIVHDYADVVVHLFDTERRKLYDLELLWGDAPRVDWRAVSLPNSPQQA